MGHWATFVYIHIHLQHSPSKRTYIVCLQMMCTIFETTRMYRQKKRRQDSSKCTVCLVGSKAKQAIRDINWTLQWCLFEHICNYHISYHNQYRSLTSTLTVIHWCRWMTDCPSVSPLLDCVCTMTINVMTTVNHLVSFNMCRVTKGHVQYFCVFHSGVCIDSEGFTSLHCLLSCLQSLFIIIFHTLFIEVMNSQSPHVLFALSWCSLPKSALSGLNVNAAFYSYIIVDTIH